MVDRSTSDSLLDVVQKPVPPGGLVVETRGFSLRSPFLTVRHSLLYSDPDVLDFIASWIAVRSS